MIRTSFRLALDTIRRLDAIAAALRKRQVGNVTRADVLRMLLESGLDLAERRVKRGAKRRKPRPPR